MKALAGYLTVVFIIAISFSLFFMFGYEASFSPFEKVVALLLIVIAICLLYLVNILKVIADNTNYLPTTDSTRNIQSKLHDQNSFWFPHILEELRTLNRHH